MTSPSYDNQQYTDNNTPADLIFSIDNVRCYYGPQLSQVVNGRMDLLHYFDPSGDGIGTSFIQISPSESKNNAQDLVTIPILPGVTRIDHPNGHLYQFNVYNPPEEQYYIELHPKASLDEVTSLCDMLMQLMAFPEGNQVGTTYQGPVKTALPPQTLALVTPTGDVLGVICGGFNDTIPPKANQNAPVVVESQNVSILDTAGSWAVKGASYIGAGIVFGAALLGSGMKSGSEYLANKTTPAEKPMQISPSTKKTVENVNYYSQKAVEISNQTLRRVNGYAAQFGKKVGEAVTKNDKNGKSSSTWKLVRNVVHAVDLVGDSVERGIKTLAADAKVATSHYFGHKYGLEAKQVAESSMGIIENATLIYVDAHGISRRALVKAIGKGAVKYKLNDGRQVTMQPLDDGAMRITEVTDTPSTFPQVASSSSSTKKN